MPSTLLGFSCAENYLLSTRFPKSKLAIAWCYDPNPYIAEGNLLVSYMIR